MAFFKSLVRFIKYHSLMQTVQSPSSSSIHCILLVCSLGEIYCHVCCEVNRLTLHQLSPKNLKIRIRSAPFHSYGMKAVLCVLQVTNCQEQLFHEVSYLQMPTTQPSFPTTHISKYHYLSFIILSKNHNSFNLA